MSYKITVRIYQTNPNTFFKVVEQTVWNYANGGSWSESNGALVLDMGGSGTSGCLRLSNESGSEKFIVAFGVHNYKRWTDIVTGLTTDTGVVIHPQWYQDSHPDREKQREAQLASYQVKNSQGRQLQVNFTKTEGNDLAANLIIG